MKKITLTLVVVYLFAVAIPHYASSVKADTIKPIKLEVAHQEVLNTATPQSKPKFGPYAFPKDVGYLHAGEPNAHSYNLREMYLAGGYDPDSAESRRKADLDTYYNHKAEIDDLIRSRTKTDDPERFVLDNMAVPCEICGCIMYIHYALCLNGFIPLSCYTHPLTCCWFWNM